MLLRRWTRTLGLRGRNRFESRSLVTGPKRLDPQTQRAALRKLLILDAAEQLGDLRVPPGNRLEKLRGDRANTYSIRINDQFRVCFVWSPRGPSRVEVVDYH